MRQVTHIRAGEGPKFWAVDDTYTIKATGEHTGGALSLVEASVPAGGGPPPHVHGGEDEAFYVLEGEFEFLDGEKMFVAGPGSFVYVPKGTLHRFRNVGYGHGRLLILYTPSGFEQFFAAIGRPARPGEPAPALDEAEIARTEEAAPRFGMEVRFPTEAAA